MKDYEEQGRAPVQAVKSKEEMRKAVATPWRNADEWAKVVKKPTSVPINRQPQGAQQPQQNAKPAATVQPRKEVCLY